MDLTALLPSDCVLPRISARTKEEILGELTMPLVRRHGLRAEELLQALLAREALGSTAVGEGVAIPHSKISRLDSLVLVVGRSLEGIDFCAPDNQLCRLFFLILTPENGAGQYLRLLAQIARRAKDSAFRSSLLLAPDGAVLRQAFIAP